MEMVLAAEGKKCEAKKGSLRFIARKLLERAAEETQAAKEIGDRLDGKPAQAIEHSGSLGTYDLSKLPDDKLDSLETILRTASVTGGGDSGETETRH